jgi:hypothetical protein
MPRPTDEAPGRLNNTLPRILFFRKKGDAKKSATPSWGTLARGRPGPAAKRDPRPAFRRLRRQQKQVSQFPVRHCEFRTGLRPVPLDETGHPLFHTLRPPFAGRTAALLLLFPTPGLLRNFAPRNDHPARSEAAGGRSQRWRNKGTLQAFFQAPPKLSCFAPSLSKQIFGGFVGFQGVTRFPNAL